MWIDRNFHGTNLDNKTLFEMWVALATLKPIKSIAEMKTKF